MKNLIFLALCISFAFCACKKEDKTDYDARDKKIIERYIDSLDLKNVIATESGLHYIVLDPGDAARPTLSSTLTVAYKGYLTDGYVFDETKTSPVGLVLSQTVKGWQEGLQKFGRGGRGILLIPSNLGYGSKAQTNIPAHSVLIFEFRLVTF